MSTFLEALKAKSEIINTNRVQLKKPIKIDSRVSFVTPIEQVSTVKINAKIEPLDTFERYKKQIDELCKELKMDSVDLMIEAINSLHFKTFNN